MSQTGAAVRRPAADGPPAEQTGRRGRSLLRGLAGTARPRQWTKNALVAAAPLAAGRLLEPDVLIATLTAFAALCLAASGTYFLNDARDVEADRLHPRKRHRPIAAGLVPVPVAHVTAVALMAAGVAVAALGGPALAAVVAAYVVLTVAYTLVLKHQVLLDLVAVSGGFVLRAAAGGAAAGLELSPFFLLVASSGSLFMVAGKRYAEFLLMGEERASTRASLASYSLSYLHFVWTSAAVVTVLAYCLYAFGVGTPSPPSPLVELSTLPFVVGVLRYALVIDRGDAGAPEDVVLGDRQLQLLGLLWLAAFSTGVVLG